MNFFVTRDVSTGFDGFFPPPSVSYRGTEVPEMIGYSMNEDTMTLMLSGEVDHHSAAAMRKEADEQT